MDAVVHKIDAAIQASIDPRDGWAVKEFHPKFASSLKTDGRKTLH